MTEKKMLAAVAVACLILLQAACGGNAGSPAAPGPAALGPIDPALVGIWSGRILSGPFGQGDMTLNLSADATAWFEGTGRYCRANGNWGVSGTAFTARGSDCDATVITLVAPVSSTTLAGSFTTSRGDPGRFSVTKQ